MLESLLLNEQVQKVGGDGPRVLESLVDLRGEKKVQELAVVQLPRAGHHHR